MILKNFENYVIFILKTCFHRTQKSKWTGLPFPSCASKMTFRCPLARIAPGDSVHHPRCPHSLPSGLLFQLLLWSLAFHDLIIMLLGLVWFMCSSLGFYGSSWIGALCLSLNFGHFWSFTSSTLLRLSQKSSTADGVLPLLLMLVSLFPSYFSLFHFD